TIWGLSRLLLQTGQGGLVFASELKALAGVKGVNSAVDAVALADYLTYLWSPSERTMLQGVKKLRPGHWLRAKVAEHGDVKVDVRAWWWPPQAPLKHGRAVYDYVKSAEGLREVFDAVVAEQCVADVPLGAFLSGGVDSSAIVASMVAQKLKPAMTYCIGFKGAGMAAEGFEEDMAHARNVAKFLKVKLREIVVEPTGILARLPKLAWTLDEPCADPAPLFVEDISLAARADGLKVLMSGTGGDDVMSGYRRHMVACQRQKLGFLAAPMGMAAGALAPWLGGARRRRAERLGELLRSDEETFLRQAFATNGVGFGLGMGAGLLNRDLREQVQTARSEGWQDELARAQRESHSQDLLNRLLYAELFGFLPDHNLNYGDKAGMAAGVEIRVPFTDRRLLNWMADVSPAWKLRGGWLGMEAKAFFKDSQVERLPDSVLNRSKTGFGAPVRHWLTTEGKAQVEACLFEGEAAAWWDAKAVGRLWQDTLSGRVDGAYTILALCMAGWWQAGHKSQ
ncbi:MAG: hypothetical protein EBQ80_05615, partial [Proteobacteria bacterium]|nr:hypothetical protein [Pseudomonadota bacterium]